MGDSQVILFHITERKPARTDSHILGQPADVSLSGRIAVARSSSHQQQQTPQSVKCETKKAKGADVLCEDVFPLKFLSDELLMILLQHFDFPTQCRYRRIARKWQYILGMLDLTESVFFDGDSFSTEDVSFAHWTRPGHDGPTAADCVKIREITLNGLHKCFPLGDSETASLLSQFARLCPNLELLQLRGLTIGKAEFWLKYHSSTYTITFTSCTIRFTDEYEEFTTGQPQLTAWSCAIPTMTILPSDDHADRVARWNTLLWPYPRDQAAWLFRCIGRLSNDPRWSDMLLATDKDDFSVTTLFNAGYFGDWVDMRKFRVQIRASADNSGEVTTVVLNEYGNYFFLITGEAFVKLAALVMANVDPVFEAPPHPFHFLAPV
ncbi:hypothetical protein BV898_07163 [Hypsibius exemplaris]|uniref:F-box domain-containing protein n=1 Tax=Hypsibius exemplaris TaxID=2072580 RepID=A0A1W0WU43_HYPEX|nr:hypothetical protein BV898_07163 [Hypsibius exemplaris]